MHHVTLHEYFHIKILEEFDVDLSDLSKVVIIKWQYVATTPCKCNYSSEFACIMLKLYREKCCLHENVSQI